MGLVVAMACVTWRGPLILQLDFPFGSSVQVHHPTSYTASSGVFPRRIRTECVREVKRFHNEKGKGNCSTNSVLSPRPGMTGAAWARPACRRRPRHRMGARQETLDRYRHLRTITNQHLSGALKHLSKTAIKEAARRIGLWSAGKLVLDSP